MQNNRVSNVRTRLRSISAAAAYRPLCFMHIIILRVRIRERRRASTRTETPCARSTLGYDLRMNRVRPRAVRSSFMNESGSPGDGRRRATADRRRGSPFPRRVICSVTGRGGSIVTAEIYRSCIHIIIRTYKRTRGAGPVPVVNVLLLPRPVRCSAQHRRAGKPAMQGFGPEASEN